MNPSHRRGDAPTGAARAVRTVRELAGLARKVVPAYAKGNAQVEGFVKVATDTRDGSPIAPERSRDPVARVGLAAFDPLARALATGFDVGALVSGVVSSDATELAFDALGSDAVVDRRRESRKAGAERGGILAVLAVDEDGAPVERSGPAQPDARTAAEISRAVDRLRRELQSARFQAMLTFSRGGAYVRAVPRATVVVVVEPGVDLRRVSSLVPDPSTYQRPVPTETVATTSAYTNGARAATTNGANTNGAHSNGSSIRVTPQASPVRAAPPAPPSRPATSAAPRPAPAAEPRKKSGLVGGVIAGLGDFTVRKIFGDPAKDAAPSRATSKAQAAPPPPAPSPTRIARAEVEDTGTRLLRAAEDYLGPRTLDRIIAEASPRTFAWQNRRVVVRGDERVPQDRANDVYREIRELFGRGAAVSDALRRFDYDAWLAAQQLAAQHAGVARAALTGGGAA